jgi:maleate isomerase
MRDRRRLGLLVPSSDVVMEADLWRRLPPVLNLHVARMYLESTTVAGEEKMLDEELAPAARRVASVHPELVIFGCTSAAALRGLDGDAAIAGLVEGIAACPCITVVQAALHEIRRLEPRHLLLVTPYIEEINERMQNTFLEAGLPVTRVVGMGLDDDLDIGAVPPKEIRHFVVAATRETTPAPECIFVSCTTFRAFEVAEDLEQELGIPVITSNRGAFRAALRHLGEK